MPFVRTPRGVKNVFSPAKVSETITRAYQFVYGQNTILHRQKIIDHTQDIITILQDKYGADITSEWKQVDITKEVETELRTKANIDVHEAFLTLNPTFDIERTQYKKFNINTNAFDPSWNVYIYREENETEFFIRLKNLKMKGQDTGNVKKRIRKVQINKRRSQWIDFWKEMTGHSIYSIDFEVFEKNIRKYNDTYSMNSEGWWKFWNNVIFESMKDDPRMYHILRVALMRVNRSVLIGQDWLDGSGLNVNDGQDEGQFHFLGDQADYIYKDLWKKHVKRFSFQKGMNTLFTKTYNLDKLAEVLDIKRDMIIDWRGYQYLLKTGSLWSIPEGTKWNITGFSFVANKNAFEPPQWAFMRLAMALAMEEKADEREKSCISFYNLFSRLAIVPTATMLREAGKADPNFLEDQAALVSDNYEAIWGEAINQTTVGTKWTGTVSLDWREVRAKGSKIGGGVRQSLGVKSFLETINAALIAQNRDEDDKPVTAILPIWHLDSASFVDNKNNNLNRLQLTLLLSDLFIQRAKNAEDWTFFDPNVFPEVLKGDEESYLLAEKLIAERKKANPKSYKVKKANKVLNKIINTMKDGYPYLVFEDNNKAFNLFADYLPCTHGVDGVGSFPTRHNEEDHMKWTKWPSMAVNIDVCLDKDGKPVINRLKVMVSIALKMLDNAISASSVDKNTADFRPVCLGAIGFHEAITRAVENSVYDGNVEEQWMEALSEAWGSTVIQADLDLAKERGASKIFNEFKDFYDPISGVEKLRKSHKGSLGINISDKQKSSWNTIVNLASKIGHRFTARTVWAPFKDSAAIAGVSPGGIGSIMPAEKIYDEFGVARWIPTPLLLNAVRKRQQDLKSLRQILRFPNNPNRWDKDILRISRPDETTWRSILRQASLVRPWIDQGVTLTLPSGIDRNRLYNLVEQAWWSGVSSIRFEKIQDSISEDNSSIQEVLKDEWED